MDVYESLTRQELVRKLLAQIIRELNPTIPIIATTAFAFETDREMALAAGCNEYMSKPLEAEKLKTMIERYLENKL